MATTSEPAAAPAEVTTPRGRAPRRAVNPETGEKRVFWNGEPLDAKGNVVDPDAPAPAPVAPEPPPPAEPSPAYDGDPDGDDFDGPGPGPGPGGGPGPEFDPGPVPPEFRPELGRDIPTPGPVPFLRDKKQQQAMAENLDQYLAASFDFDTNDYTATLVREKPQTWKGTDISGFMGKYERPLPTDEVKEMFGGGQYRWLIHGPDPRHGGKVGILANKQFKISGKPIVEDEEKPQQEAQLIRDVIQAKERDMARMQREVEENRKALAQTRGASENGLKDIVATIAQMASANANPAGLAAALAEERRATDLKLAAEREERRTAEAAAERRHKETMEMLRLQHEKDMARMQADAQRAEAEARRLADEARAAMKDKAATESQLFVTMQKMQTDMLTAVNKVTESNEAKNREHQQFMFELSQKANAANMEQLKSAKELETTILMKALDRAEDHKKGSLEVRITEMMLEKAMGEMGLINEEKSPVREVVDGVKEFASPLLAQFLTQRSGPAPTAPGAPLPGSVAVVDLPAGPRRPRRGPPGVKKRPAPAPAAQTAMEILSPPKAPPPPGTPPEWAPVMPEGSEEINVQIQMLVTNLEEALKHDWEVKQIWDQIVARYPVPVLDALRDAGVDLSVQMIQQMAPEDWILRTPRGRKLVDDLHMIMTQHRATR